MKTINILSTMLCVMLLAALPITAQNTDETKNKAIIETTEGNQELNTDDIQSIRFDGGKITVVQSWGETTFDRTLRSLSFQRPNPGTLRLTAATTIGSDNNQSNQRRAQAIDGDGKLKSTWASGDVVYVYADESTTTNIGTLAPTSYGKSTATLTGNINADGLTNGQTLYFSTQPRPFNFSSQDGTVKSLFYFTATGTLTIDGANASISDLAFTRPIAVVKFTLIDKATGNPAINAKSFTVYDGTNTYVVTPATATDELFVGIPSITSQTVTLAASDGISNYSYEKTGVSFTDNKYYAINVKMTNNTNYLTIPLTFEAKTAGAVVSFSSTMDTPPTIEYSLNGGAWTTYSSGITLTNVGDKVSFRGNNATYASINDSKYSSFSCDKDCYIYGNIMSLISKDGFASATSLTENDVFYDMFYNNTHIYDHASKTLKLPATTLTQYCYYGLFYGCSNLTKAPELPATTLAFYCYAFMFSNCTHLTTAPALPATTLATSCYRSMFQGCTSLTTAPALPATTLASSCYTDMFRGCTSLTTAPAALPATTLADYCYQQMFYGCTSLTTAPILPATELKPQCYYCMFLNCSKLNSVTCLATDISASNCTGSWLNNVAASGTFYKASTMNSWPVGPQGTYGNVKGIPSNWTVKNYVEGALKGEFTINGSGDQVYFSQGNLQAIFASAGNSCTWQFAAKQWDFVGDAAANTSINGNGSVSAAGTVDLFDWSTSATYFGINNSFAPDDYSGDFVEWGTNIGSGWRTPSDAEWTWLIGPADSPIPGTNCRTSSTIGGTENARWLKAQINSDVSAVMGLIIFPDVFTWDATSMGAAPTTCNIQDDNFTHTLSSAQWTAIEAAGAVFLPINHCRFGTDIQASDFTGYYWSSTLESATTARHIYFHSYSVGPTYSERRIGYSVRLVKNIMSAGSISYATTAVNKLSVDAAFTNELTKVGDGTVTYAVSSGDDICTVNATTGLVTLNGNAGSCTITATVTDGPYYTYATNTASYTLTVTAATLSVTANDYNDTYDGAAHGITVTCDGATIKYRTTDSGEYDLTVNPTYSDAGTYTVYYQVTRDYYTTVTGSKIVTITQASNSFTTQPTITGWTYGQSANAPTGGVVEFGDIVYKYCATADGTYDTYANVVNGQAGTWYVKGFVDETTNYAAAESDAVNFTISAAAASVTAPTAVDGTLTYNDSAQTLFNAGSSSDGTLKYKVTTTSDQPTSTEGFSAFGESISQRTNAGTYYLWYYVDGDANHNDTEINATGISMSIDQKPLTITAKAQTVNYGIAITQGTNQVTTGSLCSGHSLTGITLTQSTTDVTTNGTITPSAATIEDNLNNVVTSNYNITYSTGVLTVLPVLDLSSVTANTTVQDGWTVTGTLGGNRKISIADGATVTLSNATINGVDNYSYNWAGLNCIGDATIILADGTTNTVKGFYNHYPGIHVPSGKTLTIQGTGALDASSNGWAAGIGGGSSISCGNITIEGGTITAMGGNNGAGIGCGKATCGNISITGGTVEATGGSNAAGIGGSTDTSCGNISITGGTVTATGGSSGAGIGSGCYQSGSSSCGTITISGGTVTATGGSYAAGIGNGANASCGDITIENTVTRVTATKGSSATNSIGKGYGGTCGTVTIGGTVYWNGSSYQNDGNTYLPTSPLVYPLTIDLSTVTANTTVADGYTITGTLSGNYQISIADGATVTLKNVTINRTSSSNPGITCNGTATITLVGTNTVNGGLNQAGIKIGGTGTLTIEGDGSLSATGGGMSAGIGIGRAWDAGTVAGGNIVINGGIITAQGGSQWGAGIGTGAAYATAVTIGNIVINGGTVNATGGSQGGAAGIGTSFTYGNASTNMGDITINGGTVNATGNGYAAGIGTGESNGSPVNRVGNITINSTVTRVTATKGSSATHSIGKGSSSTEVGTVTIGGVVGAISASPYTYKGLLQLHIGPATIYYKEGETWGNAIYNHSSYNDYWDDNGGNVYYEGEPLYTLYNGSWIPVASDMPIDPDSGYHF